MPNGWEWCRLSNICLILNGDRGQNYPAKSKLHSEGIPFVSASNIIDGEVSTEGLLYLSDEQYDLLGAGKLELNDIVFCIRGSLGKCGYFTMEKGAIASSLVIVRAISNKEYLNGYIFNYLNSLFAYDEIKKYDNGSAQPNLAAKDFQNFLVPLPTNEEIGRISDKCEILLMNENNISVAAEELQDCISNTKSKILDLAIRGKLVPQNPNDEPASILLKRIREEKESLIKQGKIKHDKKESIIYKGDDNSYYEKKSEGNPFNISAEVPFQIPDSWSYARLSSLFELLSGRDLTTSEYNDEANGIPYITGASNFNKGEVILNRWTSVPQVITHTGDLLITCKGTVGELSINSFGDAHIARQVMAIRNPFMLDIGYIKLCIAYYVELLKHKSKGLIPGISREDILNLLIPIPPMSEQHRIVCSFDTFTDTLSVIEASLA